MWANTSKCILQLEEYVAKTPHSVIARTLLTDVGTHSWQITREFFVIGLKCNWNPFDEDLTDLVHSLFATPYTTKASLESGFNAIKDHSRHAKANKMSPYTRWSYIAVNPFAKSGGIQTVKCTDQDFAHASSNPSGTREIRELAHFNGVRRATLPADCPQRRDLANRWRPAGGDGEVNTCQKNVLIGAYHCIYVLGSLFNDNEFKKLCHYCFLNLQNLVPREDF